MELPDCVRFGSTHRFIDLMSAGTSRVEGDRKMLDMNCAFNVHMMQADALVIPLFAKYHDGSFNDIGVDRRLSERGF